MTVDVGVVLGLLNLLAQLGLGYLVLWVKNELLKMEKSILGQVEEKYQTKALCQANARLRRWPPAEERV